jgi:hypothetical protein
MGRLLGYQHSGPCCFVGINGGRLGSDVPNHVLGLCEVVTGAGDGRYGSYPDTSYLRVCGAVVEADT